jgi:hypothetical protein
VAFGQERANKVSTFKVTKVEFLWSENRAFQRLYGHKPKVFTNLEDANLLLRHMKSEATTIGYDKTKFRITWSDGETWEGRYDLKDDARRQENPNGLCDLGDHVRGFLLFYSGDARPDHLTEAQYAMCLKAYPSSGQPCRDFLATHEL